MDRIDQLSLRFRDVLAQTEKFGPEDLWTYQEKLLTKLLAHARKTVPYYKKRIPDLPRDGRLDDAYWNTIPILTRQDAQENASRLFAKVEPKDAGEIQSAVTSGSTGRTLKIKRNDLQSIAGLALMDRGCRWWGFDGNRSLAAIASAKSAKAPPPDGLTRQGWRIGYPDAPHYLLNNTVSDRELVDWLIRKKPSYLILTSSLIEPVCRQVMRRGLSLKLEGIIGRSNIVTERTRQLCREVLGAPIADQYGAEEVGHIAAQCPTCGDYHISAEAVFVEILDSANRPCAPDETGRVVITALYNYAMPFIRYEIGDYAVVGHNEPCKLVNLPRLSSIVGRYRNVYVCRNGSIIYPRAHAPGGRIHEFLPANQIQVIQPKLGSLLVRYVPEPQDVQVDRAALTAYLREVFEEDLEVALETVTAIPRDPSGKFEDFITHIPY